VTHARRGRAAATGRGANGTSGTKIAGLVALVTLGVLLAPARARAQSDILDAPPDVIDPMQYRSAQHFAFELRFGPYRPDVDSEFVGRSNPPRTPYKDYFTNSNRLMSQVELDWQILHQFGSLGLGVGVGYFQVTGTAPEALDGEPSGDTSTLKVVPVSFSAVYRFDYIFERYNFPIVPYGKLGLDWAYWQITDGNNEIATDGMGGTGRGATLGWHASAGLALIIDFFDPEAAHDFDADLGVNHTALTFEGTHADISGLGQKDRLHVGDTTWSAGLLLEF
jgi:hypothetical protein